MAEEAGADYLGVGPIFPTSTKPDAGAALGLKALAEIAASVRLPIVGIGGVNEANAASVIEAGATGVAVVSGILHASEPENAARALKLRLVEALERASPGRKGRDR